MLNLHNEMSRLFFVLDIPFSSERTITIQFMSPSAGNGSSSIAREFALVAAQQLPKDVLLLDLNISGLSQFDDMRQDKTGRFDSLTKIENHNIDLQSIWQCEDKYQILKDQELELELFQVGMDQLHVNKNTFLNQAVSADVKLKNDGKFWAALNQQYKLVIVDSPPLASSFDGLVSSRYVDSTLVVISAEKTRRPVAKNLCDRIVDSGGHVAGVILNKRRMHIPQFMYKYL